MDGVNTRELKQLVRDFKGWKPEKELHKALRVAGQLIVQDAKTEVGKHSQSIPATIKLRVSATKLTLTAGGEGVPIAGLYEYGNKGGGKSRTFRHPVFGDQGNWVEQRRYPFLMVAVTRNAKAIERLEGVAVAESFRERGFEVTGNG